MPRTRHAPTDRKSALLSGEFGLDYARFLFGEEALADLPSYKAGPNKGRLKGHVIWLRTTGPGYHPNAGGGVGEGVTVRAWIGASQFSAEGDALRGNWLGMVQGLCGSMCFLGPDARARDIVERTRADEERAAMYREVDEAPEADNPGMAP